MTPFSLRPRLAVAVLALAACAPAVASAQESFEQRMIRGLLTGVGLIEEDKPPIDYRERAPLVVPPNAGATLPPPAPGNRLDANPAWPKDQDIERRRAAEAAERGPVLGLDRGRLLTADETRRDRVAARGVTADQAASDRRYSERFEGSNDRLSPGQLGFRGWNTGGDKPIVFTGEPERTRLTEPPPGLQTPSPNQPFGKVGDDKLEDNWLNRLFKPGEVAAGRDSGGARTSRDSAR